MAGKRRKDLLKSGIQRGMIHAVETTEDTGDGRSNVGDERPNAVFPRQISGDESNQPGGVGEEWNCDGSEDHGEDDVDVSISDSDAMENESESTDDYFSSEESDENDEPHELSEKSLLRIKRGDPEVTSLAVHSFHSHVDGKEAGRCIGGSASLKKLTIEGDGLDWMADSRLLEWFQELYGGLGFNRSIEQYSWRDCRLADRTAVAAMATFSTWFEHNGNLRSLEITGCAIGNAGTRLLASALSRRWNKSSVIRISVDANEIGDDSGKELIQALKGYSNLLELSLGDNEIGRMGCHELSDLLTNTQLKKLNIDNNCVDDRGIAAVTDALVVNTALKDLNLSFNCAITKAGWRAFSKCLRPGSGIERLDLSSTNITDEDAATLGRSLVDNAALKALSFHDLNCNGMPLITSAGWWAFFACFHGKESALEELDLRYNSMSQEGLPALADALSNNSSLKVLDLSHNNKITASGWQFFFASLGGAKFAIKELHLCGDDITGEVMADMANVLADNKTLEFLILGANSNLTSVGWSSLSRILCDKSSATAIHASNHTLHYVDLPNVPLHVQSLLRLNQRQRKREVAREKILWYHFGNGMTNVQECLSMELIELPHVISWMGRDDAGHGLLYEILRRLAPLFACEAAARASGAKRKRLW